MKTSTLPNEPRTLIILVAVLLAVRGCAPAPVIIGGKQSPDLPSVKRRAALAIVADSHARPDGVRNLLKAPQEGRSIFSAECALGRENFEVLHDTKAPQG